MIQTPPLRDTSNHFYLADENHAAYIRTLFHRARNGVPTDKTHVTLPPISEDDQALLQEFLSEIQATQHITLKRVYKYAYTLVHWREYIGEYRQNSIADLYAGINAILVSRDESGNPRYAKHTLADYVGFLKRFYLWLADNKYTAIEEKKIQKIRPPSAPLMTKTAEMLVSEQDVLDMLRACQNSRDRALVSMMYEGGFRIGEIGNMRWSQVQFNDWNCAVNVDNKTGKPRYIPLVATRPYLAAWKNDYPAPITNDGFVFLTAGKHEQLKYRGTVKQFDKITRRAGITKKVTPHILRHSRITHLIQKGFSESKIKLMMWGSIDSDMFKAYAHLTNVDLDIEVARQAGIILPDQGMKTSCLEARQCPGCRSIMGPTQHFCGNCGTELTESARNEIQSAKTQLKTLMATPRGLAQTIEYLQEMQREQGQKSVSPANG
jgi:site-specific recombinase XerD